jgi:imidazolonepropionase
MLRVIHRLDELHPVDVIPTFLVHTVPRGVDRVRYIDEVAEEMIPRFRKLADWFDIFLERGVFELEESERLLKRASEEGYRLGIHANQVYDIGGVRLALQMGVRHVDHLEILSEDDARRILEDERVYPVFLPAAEAWVFSERRGQIHHFADIPERIILSTDFNPGSSPVLSPQMIMSLAVLRYRISDPDLLLNAFTVNPARMLFLEDRGRIEEGLIADILLFDLEKTAQIPYFGTINFLKTVIKEGKRIEWVEP